jgi:hypothetical protein
MERATDPLLTGSRRQGNPPENALDDKSEPFPHSDTITESWIVLDGSHAVCKIEVVGI